MGVPADVNWNTDPEPTFGWTYVQLPNGNVQALLGGDIIGTFVKGSGGGFQPKVLGEATLNQLGLQDNGGGASAAVNVLAP